jgi:hypothetical protein
LTGFSAQASPLPSWPKSLAPQQQSVPPVPGLRRVKKAAEKFQGLVAVIGC